MKMLIALFAGLLLCTALSADEGVTTGGIIDISNTAKPEGAIHRRKENRKCQNHRLSKR